MWDFLETVIGIIVILLFASLGFLLILGLAAIFSPIIILVMLGIGIAYLVDAVIELIKVCKG